MNEKERKYDNYVFDLYGTLIDIRTDENDLKAWEKMARFYESLIRTYGLDPARSLMCGDDFICDVAGARRAGMDGFLVRY